MRLAKIVDVQYGKSMYYKIECSQMYGTVDENEGEPHMLII